MIKYKIAILGAGFVADFYMRSLAAYPNIQVAFVYDKDEQRADKFCAYWGVPRAFSIGTIMQADSGIDLVLNLTNPKSHFELSKCCLEAGKNVYSEKPLAMNLDEAKQLYALANTNDLVLMAAPCNYLSESAQHFKHAVSSGMLGKPYLVYAEMDDGLISSAPYKTWFSESGAPWPHQDEFEVGCTLEHAAYSVGWLVAAFGSVEAVKVASAQLVDDGFAPDYSCATLYFKNNVVARLTCSIVATHNHQIRVFGEKGTLLVKDVWQNHGQVLFKKVVRVRRRLITSPIPLRVKGSVKRHPKISKGSRMNYALGIVAALESIKDEKQRARNATFSLHVNEVVLAISGSASESCISTSV